MTSYDESTHFEHDGFLLRYKIVKDVNNPPPWRNEDGHGVVNMLRPLRHMPTSARSLYSSSSGVIWYYDMAASRVKAVGEGWGLPIKESTGLTSDQIIDVAIEHDFEELKRWCDNEWWYVGVEVTFEDAKEVNPKQASLWGIHSDDIEYIERIKHELAEETLPQGKFERALHRVAKSDDLTHSIEENEDGRT